MAIHGLNFEKLLRDPAVSSEVGFRMRLVVVGHPSVPVFEVMQLLKNMQELELAVAGKALPMKHRTVFSDIDDTVHPAHDAQTIAIAGQDATPIAHGEVYPAIEKVHHDLVLQPEDNTVCFPVFLCARPAMLAQKQKPELQCLAKKIADGEHHQDRGAAEKDRFCFILPGADDIGGLCESAVSILKQNLPGVQKGMITGLGRKKVERVFQYVRLFPEPSYVFIKDDGQGDFEAARRLLSLTRKQVSAQKLPTPEVLTMDGSKPSWGLLEAVSGAVHQAQSLASNKDRYVALLRQDLRSPQMPLKFSKDNPPVFDFVAIKAVKTKTGYLFPEHTRQERETLMKQIYGTKRFFYFKNYNELWSKLRAEGWVGKH